MAQRAVHEGDVKRMLARWLGDHGGGRYSVEDRFVQVTPDVAADEIAREHPWLLSERLVVKPDQLIKRRGKAGLLLIDADWPTAQAWIAGHMRQDVQIDDMRGQIDTFLIEPFVAHAPTDEYYVAIRTLRTGDEMLFYHQGGIDVGDVDTLARRLLVPIGNLPTPEMLEYNLLEQVPPNRRSLLAGFLATLYEFFVELHITYLEINPLVVQHNRIVPLDAAARLDDTATFEPGAKWWGSLVFPAPFGRHPTAEEAYIKELDAQSSASLKLTVLNPCGRIWTMVAGGGASVIYADIICDLGFAPELANYAEYAGDPSEGLTYEYARTLLYLMTREADVRHKVLVIGGGIANFTNVADTFRGIVRALMEYQEPLRAQGVRIYVRRGGPNYQEGLLIMRDLGRTLGVPIEVYGPETQMMTVVSLAVEEVN